MASFDLPMEAKLSAQRNSPSQNASRFAGATPAFTAVSVDGAGFRYEPGSIVIPYSREMEPVLIRVAHDLGLRAEGIKGRVPTNLQPIGRSRVAVYKPWTASIDEGWTRLVLDQYEFKYTTITDLQIRSGNLRAQFDAIVLPNVAGDRLATGQSSDVVPTEYSVTLVLRKLWK